MNCKYATQVSDNAFVCGLNLYGGRPSKGVCLSCIESGRNNQEFADHWKPDELPSLSIPQMAKSLVGGTVDWAKSGFHNATTEQLESRMLICKSCEFWEESGFARTGKCKQCGCSTQAKLRMATSKCPIDKWGPVTNHIK